MSRKLNVPGVLLVDLAHRLGGTETRVLDTAEALVTRGVPVRTVCLAGSPLAKKLADRGLDAMPLTARKWDPRLVPMMRRTLLAHPGWVVDAHNAQSQLAVQLASVGAATQGPRIATVHSEYRASEPGISGYSWHEAVLARSIRQGWALVPVSGNVRGYLHALGADPEQVRLIWSGIAPSAPTRSRASVRDELGLPQDSFVLLAAGRLVPVKNLGMLIDAVAQLRDSCPQMRLVIAGDGPQRPELELRASQHGVATRIKFLGHRGDVADLLGASDLLAITSTTEGLPYILIEAAAAGVPALSTAVGAIPEVFGEQAVALLPRGTELQAGGADVLAAELRALVADADRRDRLRAAAGHVQSTMLSLDSLMDATLDSYAASSGYPELRLVRHS